MHTKIRSLAIWQRVWEMIAYSLVRSKLVTSVRLKVLRLHFSDSYKRRQVTAKCYRRLITQNRCATRICYLLPPTQK